MTHISNHQLGANHRKLFSASPAPVTTADVSQRHWDHLDTDEVPSFFPDEVGFAEAFYSDQELGKTTVVPIDNKITIARDDDGWKSNHLSQKDTIESAVAQFSAKSLPWSYNDNTSGRKNKLQLATLARFKTHALREHRLGPGLRPSEIEEIIFGLSRCCKPQIKPGQ